MLPITVRQGATTLLLAIIATLLWHDAATAGEPGPVSNPDGAASALSGRQAPDVIVVMVDTLRADALDYGPTATRSPRLAEFAGAATRFSRAYAQAPWTAPSVASFVTSQYPTALGMLRHPRPLPASAKTMAELMHAQGYRTVGVSTNPFITSRNRFDRGFDAWDETLMPGSHLVTSDAVTDRVLREAARTNPETPLFVYAHYFDPHYDYVLHRGFEPDGLPAPATDHVAIGILRPKAKQRQMALTDSDLAMIRRHYASEVAFTDHQIGRLFDGLRAIGRFEQAVVVVTADHGEAFLEHGHIGHTVNAFEELVHVPLLLKAPAQATGMTVAAPVALIDVLPTLLELARVPPAPGLRGVSLARLRRPRPVFTVTHRPQLHAAVIDGAHKLVYDGPRRAYSLYDLRQDPFEHQPTLATPAIQARLSVMLDDWLAGVAPTETVTTVEIGAQEQALLRALGYGQ